ncbi:hypothetical protein HED55_12765 [Ochrobactrum haematophilum]|uniref:Uncharacterized protein n=1 Tax=Brucella haematophila TaxID=419474 RepID=A0ABX1DLM8_9HYPH|nr:hypothetical protein [Brucella haematophila]
MPHLDLPALRAFVDTIPQNYKGPGGVVAVVRTAQSSSVMPGVLPICARVSR